MFWRVEFRVSWRVEFRVLGMCSMVYFGKFDGYAVLPPTSTTQETAYWFFEVRFRRIISGTSSNRFLSFY